MLWIIIPPAFLFSAYLIRRWYLARKLRLYGIGKGAPGFQTNVRRIRVTPEIAARLRRGEEVSPEEIAEASAQAEKARGDPEEKSVRHEKQEIVNEWLPESIKAVKKRPKGKRK